jgi:hypothetical protein
MSELFSFTIKTKEYEVTKRKITPSKGVEDGVEWEPVDANTLAVPKPIKRDVLVEDALLKKYLFNTSVGDEGIVDNATHESVFEKEGVIDAFKAPAFKNKFKSQQWVVETNSPGFQFVRAYFYYEPSPYFVYPFYSRDKCRDYREEQWLEKSSPTGKTGEVYAVTIQEEYVKPRNFNEELLAEMCSRAYVSQSARVAVVARMKKIKGDFSVKQFQMASRKALEEKLCAINVYAQLLADAECKVVLMWKEISMANIFYHTHMHHVRKMDAPSISRLYKSLITSPFELSFAKTTPFPFLPEITHNHIRAVQNCSEDIRVKYDENISRDMYIAMQVYHEIMKVDLNGKEPGDEYNIDYNPQMSGHMYTVRSCIQEIMERSDTTITKELVNLGLERLCAHNIIKLVDPKNTTPRSIAENESRNDMSGGDGEVADNASPEDRFMISKVHFYTSLFASTIEGMCRRWATSSVIRPRDRNEPYPFPIAPLDASQRKAADMACTQPVFMLTGGGGTGKTEIIKEIARRCSPRSVLMTAFTARVASNLCQKAGPADTMNYWIVQHTKWQDEKRPASAHPFRHVEMLIVDEATLVGMELITKMVFILYHYGSLRHMVLVGDVQQLPSIAYGTVFKDIMTAFPYWTLELTHNYRVSSKTISANNAIISELQRSPHMGCNGIVFDDTFRLVPGLSRCTSSFDANGDRHVTEHTTLECARRLKGIFDPLIADFHGEHPEMSWHAATMDVIKRTHMIAHTNDLADFLNEGVFRLYFQSEYCITGVFDTALGVSQDPGTEPPSDIFGSGSLPSAGTLFLHQKIYFDENDRDLNLRNGEILTIVEFRDYKTDSEEEVVRTTPITSSTDFLISTSSGSLDWGGNATINAFGGIDNFNDTDPSQVDRRVRFRRDNGQFTSFFSMRTLGMCTMSPAGRKSGGGGGVAKDGPAFKRGDATTTHKYQGSESPIVFHFLPEYAAMYGDANSIYAANSRAACILVIAGNMEVMMELAKRPPKIKRTVLPQMLRLKNIKNKTEALRCAHEMEEQECARIVAERVVVIPANTLPGQLATKQLHRPQQSPHYKPLASVAKNPMPLWANQGITGGIAAKKPQPVQQRVIPPPAAPPPPTFSVDEDDFDFDMLQELLWIEEAHARASATANTAAALLSDSTADSVDASMSIPACARSDCGDDVSSTVTSEMDDSSVFTDESSYASSLEDAPMQEAFDGLGMDDSNHAPDMPAPVPRTPPVPRTAPPVKIVKKQRKRTETVPVVMQSPSHFPSSSYALDFSQPTDVVVAVAGTPPTKKRPSPQKSPRDGNGNGNTQKTITNMLGKPRPKKISCGPVAVARGGGVTSSKIQKVVQTM